MSTATRKLSQVQQAYARCKAGRDHLHKIARCMEVTEDKAGIVWERWVLANGASVVLYATPHWWDILGPVTLNGKIDATLVALDDLAKAVRS